MLRNLPIYPLILPDRQLNRATAGRHDDSRNPKHCNFLLFEIPPVLLIDQNQVQVISRAKLLVDVSKCRCQFESAQKQPDGDRLTPDRRTIHDFKLCDGFRLVVLIWGGTRRFPPDDRELHMFDFDADEEKVDFTNDDVFEVVSGLSGVRAKLGRGGTPAGEMDERESSLPENAVNGPVAKRLTLPCCTQTRCGGNLQSRPPS